MGDPQICIVDDEISVRNATERLLRSHGYATQAFASARDFLASPELASTSCLITDLRMPGMGGLELQAQLARLGHATPVIFISAYGDPATIAKAMRAGAKGFLKKPFDGPVLLSCVAQAIAAAAPPSAGSNPS
jgi:FixJ family two-component response regulator